MGGAASVASLPEVLDEPTVRKLAGDKFDEDAWKLAEKDANGNITKKTYLAVVQYKESGLDQKYAVSKSWIGETLSKISRDTFE